ncbi:MAG: YoaK family protein [Asticcacaulis sp.]
MRYPARFSLGLEVAFLVVVAFLPKAVPDMAVVVGIAFVAAVQGTSFTRIGKFAFTSVTTSANLRHFTESAMAALVFGGGRHEHREMRYFAAICSCFFIGAVLGALTTYRLGEIAVWLPIVTLSAALVLCLPWNRPLHRLMGLN